MRVLRPEHYTVVLTLMALYLLCFYNRKEGMKEDVKGVRGRTALRRNININYSARNPYYYEDTDTALYDYPFWEARPINYEIMGRKIKENPYSCFKGTNPWLPPEYPWWPIVIEETKGPAGSSNEK